MWSASNLYKRDSGRAASHPSQVSRQDVGSGWAPATVSSRMLAAASVARSLIHWRTGAVSTQPGQIAVILGPVVAPGLSGFTQGEAPHGSDRQRRRHPPGGSDRVACSRSARSSGGQMPVGRWCCAGERSDEARRAGVRSTAHGDGEALASERPTPQLVVRIRMTTNEAREPGRRRVRREAARRARWRRGAAGAA